MIKRFFLFLFTCCFSLASTAWAADPFTVAGVPVDATGDNAIEAQTAAISEGQSRAAEILIQRLTLPEQRAGKDFSRVEPETIAKLIRALEIANEKRSTQRYLGDITVAFSPAQVQQFLAAQNLTMVSTQAQTRLVLPVLEGRSLWTDNDWREAWQTGGFDHALTPVKSVAASEANDAVISAAQAQARNKAALKRAGDLFGVRQILVAQASGSPGNVRVSVSDIALDSGQARDLGTVRASSYAAAAAAVIQAVENDWKSASVSLAANAVEMPVSVLYRSHDDWQRLQEVINNSAQIQGARLDALSKDGALMTLTYGGDFDRLKNELSYKGVEVRRDPKLGPILFRKGRY